MDPIITEVLDYEKIYWQTYEAKRKTGVAKYFCGDTFIWIQFQDRRIYLYTAALNGERTLNEMKQLANKGEKLNTFINRNDVRDNYAARYEWRDGAYRRF